MDVGKGRELGAEALQACVASIAGNGKALSQPTNNVFICVYLRVFAEKDVFSVWELLAAYSHSR